MNDDGQGEYIRVAAAARRLAVSPDFIRARISAGEIPAFKLGDGRNSPLVMRQADIDDWMAGRQVTAEGAKPACHRRRRVAGRSPAATSWGV